jgi:hypothetical protein
MIMKLAARSNFWSDLYFVLEVAHRSKNWSNDCCISLDFRNWRGFNRSWKVNRYYISEWKQFTNIR